MTQPRPRDLKARPVWLVPQIFAKHFGTTLQLRIHTPETARAGGAQSLSPASLSPTSIPSRHQQPKLEAQNNLMNTPNSNPPNPHLLKPTILKPQTPQTPQTLMPETLSAPCPFLRQPPRATERAPHCRSPRLQQGVLHLRGGFRSSNLGFWASGFGLRDSGLGLRIDFEIALSTVGFRWLFRWLARDGGSRREKCEVQPFMRIPPASFVGFSAFDLPGLQETRAESQAFVH